MAKNPLLEVFGFPVSNATPEAVNHRQGRLCPFHNSSGGHCTKSSATDPIGVCSIWDGNEPVITCPIRFREGFKLIAEATEFFFPKQRYVALTETRLKDKFGKAAGNIDVVIAALDNKGNVSDFGAVEAQAVYISGNVKNAYQHYMRDPQATAAMDWPRKNYPNPDYPSSSRKRLAPQLIYKGGILHTWGKKMAVVVDESFFNQLPTLKETSKNKADIAWMVYGLQFDKRRNRHISENRRMIYTLFESALVALTTPAIGDVKDFVNHLQERISKGKVFGTLSATSLAPDVEPMDDVLSSGGGMNQLTLGFGESVPPITNVASVPQRSPFRYPGGKTWLVPRIRQWLHSQPAQPQFFVEPFAGGAIAGLTVAFEMLAQQVILVERDEQVAAVWHTIFNTPHGAEWLGERIATFALTPESAQKLLATAPHSAREKAFQAIVQNRINHGGILAQGASKIKTGENGKGMLSRWYPATLKKRLLDMAAIKARVQFIEGNGFEVMRRYANKDNAVFFVDPPYTASAKKAGARLYKYHQIDHEQLFQELRQARGDFLLTYDDAEEVRALAVKYRFETRLVAMSNTHHAKMTELLIGRNLSWMDSL
jgi:DNA adenine methylase